MKTSLLVDLIKKNGGNICFYCKRELNSADIRTQAAIDHITPLSKGGTDEISNLVLCCRSCNSKKGSKDLKDFFLHQELIKNFGDEFSFSLTDNYFSVRIPRTQLDNILEIGRKISKIVKLKK